MINVKSFKLELKDLIEDNEQVLNELDFIFCEILNMDLSKLMLLKDISNFNAYKIKRVIKQRLKGKPLTKIFKKAYFYGREFKINNNVLSPRQETEILVEKTLGVINNSYKILDLCTGSGAIGITLKKENGSLNIDASDISSKALKVAKNNAKRLNVKVNFIKSNLFEKITEKYDIIVSNPPYIKTNVINTLDLEVKKYDPVISLDGGKNGLDFYEKIIKECKKYLKDNGKIIFEIGFDQRKEVEELLKQEDFKVSCFKDYSNNDRVVMGEL